MKLCFLDAETMGDIPLTPLEQLGELTLYRTTSPEQVSGRIAGMDIVLTNKVVLTGEALRQHPGIRMIALTSTGTNVVDLDDCRHAGIAVANVAGYSTPMVVQHTFALLFYLMGSLREYDDYVKSGAYSKSRLFTYYGTPIRELSGKTWGIIGLGAIGSGVAAAASAFGAGVQYHSASGRDSGRNYPRVSLEELLRTSDVVSIHTALTPGTRNLIAAKELNRMKPSAFLLNLSRGPIVNEADLADALDRRQIAGAGLDVLEKEPPESDHPLLHIKEQNRLVITPHIAWASVESRTRLVEEIAENIRAFLEGKIRNRVEIG